MEYFDKHEFSSFEHRLLFRKRNFKAMIGSNGYSLVTTIDTTKKRVKDNVVDSVSAYENPHMLTEKGMIAEFNKRKNSTLLSLMFK